MHILITLTIVSLSVYSTEGQDSPKKDKRAWHRYEFPRPQMRNETTLCGRRSKTSSWICDPSNIISYEEANQLDTLIDSTRNGTQCACSEWACVKKKQGFTIAVALVPAMERDPDADTDAHSRLHDAKLFASSLEMRRWNYGRCEEDVVIFYSLNDNVLYTSVGGTAFKVLQHNLITEITLEASQYFGPGREIARGLRHIIGGYRNVFMGYYDYRRKKKNNSGPRYEKVTGTGSHTVKTTLLSTIIFATITSLLTYTH